MAQSIEPRQSQRSGGHISRGGHVRRAIASVVALAVVVAGLTIIPITPAEAAVVQWGTNSGTAPNYQATVNGDFVMAGNGVLACTGAALANNAGSCLNLHAATDANTANVNDNFAMVNNAPAAGFTTNSSAASITIPNGATVVKAYLSWSANTGVYTGDARTLCTAFSTTRGTATLPAGSTATGYRTQPVQLKIGSGAVVPVTASTVLEDPASQATALYYSASADVTSAFTAQGTGAPLTVSAGNIWTPTGAGCYAGWSITVVYDYGTFIPGNTNSVPHRIIFYEGHVREGQNDPNLTVAFNGFTAVEAGTRAGFTLFEGDRNITGDLAQYSRGGTTPYTEINNSAGANGNFGIGRAVGSTRYTQTGDTSTFTNQSVDVATTTLSNVIAGDSTVNLQLGTTGDSYLLRNAILSVPTAGLQIVKSYDGTLDTQSRTAAEKATFTIRVTNTGAGTLRNMVVTDDQADCARTLTGITLLPLATYTYTCTATAASAGTYVSTAAITGYTVVGNYLASDDDSTTVLLSSIALAKNSALAAGATGRAGDTLNYTFTISNNGSSPLTGVTVTDPLVGLSALTYSWPTATAGALAPGATATATATYVLKQTDVDAGSIANTASTTGTDADGGLKPTATATRTTPIAPNSTITVGKTGTLAAGATGRVGEVINYAFSFTNSGNVTLTNVALSDPLPGLTTPVVTGLGSGNSLAPGATATATASYTIKQSDVDAGSVKNTATVTGRTPAGATTTGTSPQVSVATIAAAPALTTTKTGSSAANPGVGQVITYTFRATNTGNVTLTNATIADPLPGLSAITVTGGTGTLASLAPGQFVTATATYTVRQSDVDAGAVRNIATTTASAPNAAVVTAPSTQSVVPTVAAAPAVTLAKSGTLAAGSTGAAGNTVNYSFTLTNSGNVTLTAASIVDPLPGLSAITITGGTGTLASLAPGQTVTATASYVLKQSDVDAGSVANTATASAKPPTGANVTQSRSATVPITAAGALVVTKSGAVTTGNGGVGSTVTYSFTVRNSGNVTLTQVALADPLPGLSAITTTFPAGQAVGTLAPGQTATATATYTIRQADVDAGSVKNTATASARTPGGASVTAASPQATVSTAAATPALTTTKAGTIAGGASGVAGDVIGYTFAVRNTGNVTVTGVVISDPLPGLSALTYTWPGAAGVLAPGQTATATASYVIKQSDVNTGNVKNTATGSGVFGATPVSSSSGQITTPVAPATPSIVTTKSGALASGATGRAGDTVTWTITLRNAGNVTLTAVSASDSLADISALTYGAWPSGTTGTLQPGQTVTATATYVLKQSDVDAGSVANIATGTGLPPTGAATTSTAPASLPLAAAAALTVAKSGAVTSGNGSVGDTITWSFVVRNTGNVTLNSVGVTDTLAGLSALTYGPWPSGTAGRLLPNTQVTATATYVIKQADVNAGVVRNTATASGTPPTGPAVTATSPQASVNTAAAAPAITTTKTAAPATGAGVGSVLTYTFTARNSGNVTLTGVTITDPLPGLSALTYGAWPGGVANQLQPGGVVTATATYTVTQADVNSGAVRNTASSSGTYGATTVTGPSPQVVTPTVAAAPAIALTKSGTLPAGAQGVAGETVTYSFLVRNTGNVTLTGLTLTDPLVGLSAITVTGGTGTLASLAPNQTVTATASYVLKQSDVDAGSVANTARAAGTPPTGAAVAVTAPATVVVAPAAALTVVKTGSVTTGTGVAGSTITFGFTISNPGNVTVSGITLNDSLPGLGTPVITWPGATAGTLAPAQVATGTATYTITQADVDSGSVANTASVSGRTPANATVNSPKSAVSVATAAPSRSIATTKSASIVSGARVGDVITYSIGITNTGNQTLTAVTLTDSLVGLSAPVITWPGTAGSLAPGQTATATATYVVRQSDVDNGSVTNRATSRGTAPGNVSVTNTTADVTTTTVTPVRTISLTKSGALPSGSTSRAGEIVTYSFVLRNTGNQTVTGAGITDPLPGLSAISYGTWPGGVAGTLAPNAQVTATATYTVTQADVDSGSIANTATAAATPPTGPALSTTAVETVPLAPSSALTVTKTGAVTTGTGAVGDTVTFSFVVRNAGNVSLTGVGITDTLAGLSPVTYGAWPGGVANRLAPNTQVTATATYVIAQADVNLGSVRNTATASGTPPTGPAVTAASGQAVVPTVAASPQISTTKTSTVSGTGAVGDVITYTVVGRNSGNVTLTGVTLTDPLPGLSVPSLVWSGAANVLQPGETVTGTAAHTITQTDVNAGSLTNTATVSGTPPTGPAVSTAATRVTPTAAANPSIAVTKSGALAPGSTRIVGDVVTWSMTMTNTGNVTLTGATITDSLPGISAVTYGIWPSGTPFTLGPNQTVTATATYALSQADIDSGAVSNTATATGTPPTGAAATATAPATVPLAPAASITLGKTAAYLGGGIGAVGDTVRYTFSATNTGNVTLSGVAINDPRPGLTSVSYGTWPSGTVGRLAPGQSVSATADYVVQQSDVNSGSITNTATVSGQPPTGAAATASSPTVSIATVARTATILATKTSVRSGTGIVGDVITYTLTARNTGSVTLTGVTLTDSAPGLTPLVYGTWPGGVAGTLQPNTQIVATTTHTITQADVNAGSVTNTLTASATSDVSPTVTNTSAPVTDPTVAAAPELVLAKSGALAPGATGVAGNRVNYTFTASNTGNQTLTGVTITDPMTGLSPLVITWPTATAGILQPGETATATAFYTLTQADVDAGSVQNVATSTAVRPGGATLTRTAPAAVSVAANPSLVVTKTATVTGTGAVGDRIDYTIRMSNPGNVTLSSVVLTDSLPGLSTPVITWPTATAGVLPPGTAATASASYTIVQADVDRGTVSNTASATAQRPGTTVPVTGTSGPVVAATGAGRAELTTAKTSTVSGSGVGGVITYSFRVTNTGNVTLDQVALSDPFLGASTPALTFPGAAGVLTPGAFATATATHTITQADVDAGAVVNTATSSGRSPMLMTVTSAPSSVTDATVAANAAILITKSASAASRAGDVVTWSFTLSNPGNVTLTGVSLVDSLPGATPVVASWPSGTAGRLNPGDSIALTSTSTVSQADVDAGSLVNTVTASGTPPRGSVATSTASATAPLVPTGALQTVKTAVVPNPAVVGSTVTYNFVVTNPGNVTLSDVAITDSLSGLGPVSYTSWNGDPAGTLRPGGQLNATANYVLTQADIDRGQVVNSATSRGTTPAGAAIVSPASAVTVTTVARAPQLTTTKTSVRSGTGVVGDVIRYTISVSNTGNTTVENVAIADTLPGLGGLDYNTWPRGVAGLLLPGDTITASANYTITQADVDTGSVTNTATGSGTAAVTGAPVSDPSDPDVQPTVARTATISVDKTGALDPGALGRAGNNILYSFTLTNTGNVTLASVSFNDPLVPIPAGNYTWPTSAPAGTLLPGATVTATASYSITQTDVDAGSVANTVTGSATPPGAGQTAITAPDSATVLVASDASLSAVKTGVLRPGSIGAVGDIIDYTVTVTNTGNVTVHDGQLLDPLPGISVPVITWPNPAQPGVLPVGQSVTGTASYPLTQADVDLGYISNIADVSARTPNNQLVLATTNEVIVNTVQPAPVLAVLKSATVAGTGAVGDVVTYTFTLRNDGNVTLGNIALADALPGLTITPLPWGANTARSLAPGAQISTTGTHTITQAEVDAGSIRNTATATATTPRGATVTGASPEVVTPTAAAAPAIAVTKSGTLATGAAGVPGDVVSYQFTVTNNGNVRLSGVDLIDRMPQLSNVVFGTWPGSPSHPGILDPAESVTASASYTLQQSDIDAGAISNIVSATGTPLRGSAAVAMASATVPIAPTPDLEVTKVGSLNGEEGSLGDVISYTFTIRNSGNVTATGVTLSDSLAGVSTPVISWPAAAGVLAPGATATATASYTIAQKDIDAGSVVNTASASGLTPAGDSFTRTSTPSTVATIARTPLIEVTKTGTVEGAGVAGDLTRYSFAITNRGTVTITGIDLVDTKPGLSTPQLSWPGAVGELLPGQTATGTATYTLLQADVNAGSTSNLASVSGTTTVGPVTDDTGTVVTPTASAAASIAVSKDGALAAGSTGRAGDTVQFTLSMRNTGNVTLTGVTFTDPLVDLASATYLWPGTAGVLQPNGIVTARVDYTLTQADVDNGSVTNTVTGSGTPPTGPAISQDAATTITIAPAPLLTPVKSGVILGGGTGAVGDTIEYTLRITNDGNVTMYNGQLLDPLPGLNVPVITWPIAGQPGVLPPGTTVVGVATYVLQQKDIDLGSISNIADVSAVTPKGVTVFGTSNEVIVPTVLPSPGIAVTKIGVPRGGAGVGDTIDYQFSILNTGNVTLDGVTLTDALPGLSLSAVTWPRPGIPGVLQPGEIARATGSYVITLADVNAGAVINSAATSGSSPTDVVVSAASQPSTVPTQSIAPDLAISKSATLADAGRADAGDQVNLSYLLTNTGNVTLTDVSLSDALPGISAFSYVWDGTPFTLLPGQSVRATATSALTQAQIDAGRVQSEVTGVGTPPRGAVVARTATAGVDLTQAADISVSKSGAARAGGGLGDTVDYTFRIDNTGNVTLTLVDLVDALQGVSDPTFTWTGTPGTLAPGGLVTATATYVVTQADVDAGTVTNVATASGKPPVGPVISASSPITTTTLAPEAPAITVTKDDSTGANIGVDGVISYSFVIRNSGTVTLHGITLSDPLAGLSAPAIRWPGASGVLAPGESASATASYAITQSDVNVGSVTNTATARGLSPKNVEAVSATATVVTDTAAASPEITIEKTGVLAAGATGRPGDEVDFTFVISNPGNVTVTAVQVSDNLVGLSTLAYDRAGFPGGTLQPGEFVTATAQYSLTQADIDAGSVVNVVTVAGTPPTGPAIGDDDSVSVPIPELGSLSAVKTGTLRAGGIGQLGDIIDYAVTVTNTGNVTVHNGQLLDPLPGISNPVIGWPDPAQPGVLPAGASVTGRATYALTQADIDRGFISNIADVGALTPTNQSVLATTNEVVIATVQAQPMLSITKTGTSTGTAGVGDQVDYEFVIANTGNVTVGSVAVADALPGVSTPVLQWPSAARTLAPGQSVTATATYGITQADVDAGAVRNTATATATPVRGEPTSAVSPESVVPTEQALATVTIVNSGALTAPGAPVAGSSTVTWTYEFTNTGNVTLRGVALSDLIGTLPGASLVWSGTPGELAPGGTVTATRVQALTQADIDSGAVASIVTGAGNPAVGAAATASAPATVPLAASPLLTVTKSGAPAIAGQIGLGDTMNYTLEITNTGNVTLEQVTVTDALPGVVIVGIDWPGTAGELAPGATAVATATYALQQEDVDRGRVDNTARVDAIDQAGDSVLAQSNLVSIPLEAAAPAITTAKTGTLVSGTGNAGSVIRYNFTIANTGNVTLRLVEVREALAGVSTPVIDFPSTSNILAPGGVATAVATYTVTQADVDAGRVINVATSYGTSPSGVVVSGVSNTVETTLAAAAPAIVATHTAALATGAAGVVGDTMNYTFTLRNTGNVTLAGVAMTNTVAGLTGITPTWPGAAGRLGPNQQVTYTATRLVTQADVDLGVVRNVTTGSGSTPTATVVSNSSAQTEVPLAAGAATLAVAKSGVVRGGGAAVTGATVDYTITVTNTGALTLSNVAITDAKPGIAPIVVGPWPTAAVGVLPPGASVQATTSSVVTQAEFDSGAVRNTAGASATRPGGAAVSAVSPESVVTAPAGAPAIQLTKTQLLASAATARVGDLVNFSFEITNTGDVTLSGVTLSDAQAALGPISVVWPGADGVLAPNGVARGTASYALTQADIDAGSITSTASTSGTPVVGAAVAATASGVTPIAAAPAMTVDKTSSLATFAQQGATVNYRIEVRNTGNVTLTAVDVTDALAGLSAPTFAWPGTPGTLQPGALLVVTARYTIQQSDIATGAVTNTATATAVAGTTTLAPVSDTDVLPTPNVAAIALSISPALRAGQAGFAGDTVVFTYTATNSGTGTLTGVTISDPRQGLSAIVYGQWPGAAGVLEPGQSVTATATYVLVAADEGTTLTETAQVSSVDVNNGDPVVATAAGSLQLPSRAIVPPILSLTGTDPLSGIVGSLLLLMAGLGLTLIARRRMRKELA